MNASNISEYYRISGVETVFWIALYTIEALLAIFGNLLVVIIICSKQNMRTPTNCFIFNLSLADGVTGLLVIPFKFQAALLQYWALPHILCNIIPFIESLSLTVSVLTLCLSALDRYTTIQFGYKTSNQRMLISLILVWVFSIVSSIPNAIFNNTKDVNIDGAPVYQCLLTAAPEWWKWYNFYLIVVQYFFPLLIVDGAYGAIACQLRRTPPMPTMEPLNKKIAYERNKQQVFVMLLIIVICFTFCSLPFQMYNILNDQLPFLTDFYYIPVVYFWCQWLSLLSTCLNPIIFACFNKMFRDELYNLWLKLSRILGIPKGEKVTLETNGMIDHDLSSEKSNANEALLSETWVTDTPRYGSCRLKRKPSRDGMSMMDMTFMPLAFTNRSKVRLHNYVKEELGHT